ncbi:acyl-CoA thioesterase domain-containing protein [Amycolatopsis australiensis]|uniref:Acyl-coenzyme A thioesterase PaaI, contains HGG motif n=1 Tax=Amycolatopsis australiensis TaxID=546364 RepID=A0A1K1S602_9PSEU|nr:acyl-CoA thioesterase domain-containing protein [Amycolatopsis australiensis]SFW79750.1 Acyl-coenzyme A thioesterase PaaI, contains HGG motif [Amycolatopsis australiensis]
MSFFEAGGELLHPLPAARAHWGGGGQLRGMVTSGALARAAESAVTRSGGAGLLRPARWTVDLLRPAGFEPCRATAEVVRRGRRLCLVEAALRQREVLVARATGLFLAAGTPVTGNVWAPDDAPPLPPPGLRPSTTEPRVYYSESTGWTSSPEPHQNSGRKMLWAFPQELVRGERPTPFQHAAMVADLVNLVTNWGDAGLEFINADLSLALSRPPAEDLHLGLSTIHRAEDDGVAVATAAVFDRDGAFGTVTGTAIIAAAPVDPRRVVAGAGERAQQAP